MQSRLQPPLRGDIVWAMRAIAFRRVLPPIQVVLFLTLFGLGRAHRRIYEIPLEAGSVGFACGGESDIPCPHDLDDAGTAINFPASLFTFPFFAIPGVDKNLPVQALIFSVGVFFFWYLMGRWIDRTVGSLPSAKRIPSLLVRISVWLVLLVCLLFGLLSLYRWFRGGMFVPRHDIMALALFLWCAFGATFLVASLLRWHTLEKAEKKAGGIETPS